MTKKVSLQYKIHLEYMYCISSPGYNHDVPNFTIENEQQISRVLSYMYLVWIGFNEMKKEMFILATAIANEQYTSHRSVD